MKQTILIIALSLLCSITMSSQSRFDLGIFLGMSSHGGDANSWAKDGQGMFETSKPAFGLSITNNLSTQFGLSLNLSSTTLEGNDMNLAEKDAWGAEHASRGYAYKTSLIEVGIGAIVRPFDKPSAEGGQNKLSPFITGGIAVAIVSDDEDSRVWLNVPENRTGAADVDQRNGSEGGIQIPLGLGLRYNLNSKMYLDLVYNARLPLGDYLDGISLAANPDKNDAYQFCGINFGLRLGATTPAESN